MNLRKDHYRTIQDLTLWLLLAIDSPLHNEILWCQQIEASVQLRRVTRPIEKWVWATHMLHFYCTSKMSSPYHLLSKYTRKPCGVIGLESVLGWGAPTLHSLLRGLALEVHIAYLQCICHADLFGWGKILIVIICAIPLWWCHLCDWFSPLPIL